MAAPTFVETTEQICTVVFLCLPALHEGQAGNFYPLLPGCGRAETAAQTVTATT